MQMEKSVILWKCRYLMLIRRFFAHQCHHTLPHAFQLITRFVLSNRQSVSLCQPFEQRRITPIPIISAVWSNAEAFQSTRSSILHPLTPSSTTKHHVENTIRSYNSRPAARAFLCHGPRPPACASAREDQKPMKYHVSHHFPYAMQRD